MYSLTCIEYILKLKKKTCSFRDFKCLYNDSSKASFIEMLNNRELNISTDWDWVNRKSVFNVLATVIVLLVVPSHVYRSPATTLLGLTGKLAWEMHSNHQAGILMQETENQQTEHESEERNWIMKKTHPKLENDGVIKNSQLKQGNVTLLLISLQ